MSNEDEGKLSKLGASSVYSASTEPADVEMDRYFDFDGSDYDDFCSCDSKNCCEECVTFTTADWDDNARPPSIMRDPLMSAFSSDSSSSLILPDSTTSASPCLPDSTSQESGEQEVPTSKLSPSKKITTGDTDSGEEASSEEEYFTD